MPSRRYHVDQPQAYAPPPFCTRRDLACRRPGVDPAWFYPERGQNARQAREVCAGCPVLGECLDWALSTDQRHGVWGGLSPDERTDLPRRKVAA